LYSLLRIDTPTRRTAFVVISGVLVLAYITVSSLSYIAYRYSRAGTRESLQTAVRLEPGNPEYRWRLGRAEFYGESDSASAEKEYEKALSLNSYNPHYWLDYANALYNQNRVAENQKAIEHAVQLDPTSPRTNWEAGNMYLVGGDTVAAFHQFRNILSRGINTSAYPVIPLCWRVTKDADLIIREALPTRPDFLLQFLNLVVADRSSEAAATVWATIVRLKQNFDAKLAFPYFDYLVETRDVDAAMGVWKFLESAGSLADYAQPENLLVNAGFEKPVLNGGLDWRYRQGRAVNLSLDNDQAHSGKASLAVNFSGATADIGIAQIVAVEPNTTYDFSAFAKGHGLEGAGGPQFEIQDAYTLERLLLTDDLTDTFNWRLIEGNFHTGAGTKLVMVRVVRVPGNTLIRGKLWIDDLSIRKR